MEQGDKRALGWLGRWGSRRTVRSGDRERQGLCMQVGSLLYLCTGTCVCVCVRNVRLSAPVHARSQVHRTTCMYEYYVDYIGTVSRAIHRCIVHIVHLHTGRYIVHAHRLALVYINMQ